MGYVQIGNTFYGDPEEGSPNALEKEIYTLFTCEVCNKPHDFNGSVIINSRWVCSACHAVM